MRSVRGHLALRLGAAAPWNPAFADLATALRPIDLFLTFCELRTTMEKTINTDKRSKQSDSWEVDSEQ